MYQINYLFKTAEEDNFEAGLVMGTDQSMHIDQRFNAETLPGLFKKVCEFLGLEYTGDSFEIDPCGDDVNRVDFSCMENSEAEIPTARELAAWRKNGVKLWSCTYTAYVLKTEAVDINKALEA